MPGRLPSCFFGLCNTSSSLSEERSAQLDPAASAGTRARKHFRCGAQDLRGRCAVKSVLPRGAVERTRPMDVFRSNSDNLLLQWQTYSHSVEEPFSCRSYYAFVCNTTNSSRPSRMRNAYGARFCHLQSWLRYRACQMEFGWLNCATIIYFTRDGAKVKPRPSSMRWLK